MARRKTHHPTCPRCGYDQSGPIATWHTQCPLNGLCTECGLTFAWADILNPERQSLEGFAEHANSPSRYIRWSWRTWAWLILPWRFWSRVQMHHDIRPKRLLLWPALILLCLHIPQAVIRMFTVFLESTITGTPIFGAGARPWQQHWYQDMLATAWTSPVGYIYLPRGRNKNIINALPTIDIDPFLWIIPSASVIAAFPILLLLMPVTRKRAKVRLAHLVRATVYSVAIVSFTYTLGIFQGIEGAFAADIDLAMLTTESDWLSVPLALIPASPDTISIISNTLTILIPLAWISAYWYAAVSRGMRLPNPRLHWAVLMIAVACVGLLANVYAVANIFEAML